jgi:hypothetical protein
VVAGGSQLTLYEVTAAQSELRVSSDGRIAEAPLASQLRARSVFPIHGALKSVQRIALSGAAADAASGRKAIDVLMLTLGQGKVSIVGFDPLSACLRTLVLLNFEHDAIGPTAAPQLAAQRTVTQVRSNL